MSNGGFVPVRITGCITIDSHVHSGFLEEAYDFLSKPPLKKPPKHTTRVKAAAKLLTQLNAASSSSTINIIGHGFEGLILTGSGETPTSNSNKFIGVDNASDWEAQNNLLAMKGMFGLGRLCACDAGAGADGASLLFSLATTLNAPFEAPTGLLFCDDNGFFLEPKANWQRATPTNKPERIDPPKQYVTSPAMDTLILGSATGDVAIPIADVMAVSITAADLPRFARLTFTGDRARRAATFVQFNKPLKMGAVPAAVATGTFLVGFKHEGQVEQRALRIYNDRLLQDLTMSDEAHRYYYYANVMDLMVSPRTE